MNFLKSQHLDFFDSLSWNSVFSFLLKFGIFQSVILSGAYGAMDIIMILGVYPNLFGNNQAEMVQ